LPGAVLLPNALSFLHMLLNCSIIVPGKKH
jgi:hypothetical protein